MSAKSFSPTTSMRADKRSSISSSSSPPSSSSSSSSTSWEPPEAASSKLTVIKTLKVQTLVDSSRPEDHRQGTAALGREKNSSPKAQKASTMTRDETKNKSLAGSSATKQRLAIQKPSGRLNAATLSPSSPTSSTSSSSTYKRYKLTLTNHFLTMPEVDQPNDVGSYQRELLERAISGSKAGAGVESTQKQRLQKHQHKEVEDQDSDDNCDLSVLPPSSPDLNSLLSHETITEYDNEVAQHKRQASSSASARPDILMMAPQQTLGFNSKRNQKRASQSAVSPASDPPQERVAGVAEKFSRVLPAGDAGLDAGRCNSKASANVDECYLSSPYLMSDNTGGTGIASKHHVNYLQRHKTLASDEPNLHHNLHHHQHRNRHDEEDDEHHEHHLRMLKKKRKLNGEPDDCASNGLLVRFSSIMYATFLVILGCILHVSELKQKSRNSSDHIYTTIVASIGILWLIYLQADLQRYKKYASKFILLESIFNDRGHLHPQQVAASGAIVQQLQGKGGGGIQGDALFGVGLDPTSRSTSSSSASLVNDRMSLNTDVIFKKTAYKMYQHQQAHSRRQKYQKGVSSASIMGENGAGEQRLGGADQEGPTGGTSKLVPAYKFLHGKMGANFYLKCGMAAFCFGHVIHEGLRFGQQVYFFATANLACRDSAALVAHLVTPLYSFYQLFMMFKYSNLVINRHKILARFGLMHIIGTCVSFWFRTILEEAFEDFVHKMDYFKAQNKPINHYLDITANSNTHHPADSPPILIVGSGPTSTPSAASGQSSLADWFNAISALTNGVATAGTESLLSPRQIASAQLNQSNLGAASQQLVLPAQNLTLAQSALLALMSSPISATITPQLVRHLPDSYHCAQNTLLTTKSMNALPYLYPFTIEYNLLIAATFLSLYFNIGKINHSPASPGASRCYSCPTSICCKAHAANSGSSQHNHHHHQACGVQSSSASASAFYRINKQPGSSSSGTSFMDSQLDLGVAGSDIGSSSAILNRYGHNGNQLMQQQREQKAAHEHLGEYKSNFVVNADCHAANKGLFLGFFVLLVTLVTIVIFFVTINKPTHLQLGIKINLIQEATLTSLILIVTLAGYRQIMRLNRNPFVKDKVTTDDVLMLIPLPFFFIHSLLSFRAETATLYSAHHQLTKQSALHSHQKAAEPATASASAASSLNAAEAATRVLNVTTATSHARQRRIPAANSGAESSTRGQAGPGGGGLDQQRRQQRQQPRTDFLLNLPSGLAARSTSGFNNNSLLNRRNSTFESRPPSAAAQTQQPPPLLQAAKIDRFKLLTIVLNLAVMIEVLVQTNFIIDGLRRCSESRYLRFKKPGRELITFAILLNITYWIVATFETKSVEQYKTEIDYYGPLPYMFISHTTLPVMLFYRYHSSVCLAEIWNRAYKSPKRR